MTIKGICCTETHYPGDTTSLNIQRKVEHYQQLLQHISVYSLHNLDLITKHRMWNGELRGLCRREGHFEKESWSWALEQSSRADGLSDGPVTWLEPITEGESAREKAGMSCTARILFLSCCQLKQAALHLHVDARPALLASIHLGTELAVQPALNEGLCVHKGGWRVYSGTHTWQLGWTNPGKIKDSCLFLSFSPLLDSFLFILCLSKTDRQTCRYMELKISKCMGWEMTNCNPHRINHSWCLPYWKCPDSYGIQQNVIGIYFTLQTCLHISKTPFKILRLKQTQESIQ